MFHKSYFGFSKDEERNIRSFHHRLLTTDGNIHECNACSTSLNESKPLSEHWLPKNEENNLVDLKLNHEDQAALDNIDARNIQDFFLHDHSDSEKSTPFLHLSETETIPNMLKWLFQKSVKLDFKLTYYVYVAEKVHYFNTTSLSIAHHYDIPESVGMLHQMMLKSITLYVKYSYDLTIENCTIKRIRMHVERTWRNSLEEGVIHGDNLMAMPLRFRKDVPESDEDYEVYSLTREFYNYQDAFLRKQLCPDQFNNPPPSMHLYCLRQCELTLEQYLVPFHISETEQPTDEVKKFVILNDVEGKFHRLHEITNPPNYNLEDIQPDTTDLQPSVLRCERCDDFFAIPSNLMIHQYLNCGNDFSVQIADEDTPEFYETCYPFAKNSTNHAWYAIKEITDDAWNEIMPTKYEQIDR